jgi:hypothetical protein
MMRTTRSTVTFRDPFMLNRDVGELPAGSYDIEIDEEEIPTLDRPAFRRTAIYFYVENQGSTRTLVIDPGDLESALRRDAEKPDGAPFTERSAALPPDETSA